MGANSNEGVTGPNRLRNNPAVTIYKANDKNVLEYAEGKLFAPVAQGSEESASIRFFEENKGAFRMTDPASELRLKRTQSDDLGMKHLRFEQYYNGLRVIGGELVTHFTEDGILKTVNGNFEPEINIGTSPSIQDQEAIQAAQRDLESIFGKGNPGQAELVVFPWEGNYFLA